MFAVHVFTSNARGPQAVPQNVSNRPRSSSQKSSKKSSQKCLQRGKIDGKVDQYTGNSRNAKSCMPLEQNAHIYKEFSVKMLPQLPINSSNKAQQLAPQKASPRPSHERQNMTPDRRKHKFYLGFWWFQQGATIRTSPLKCLLKSLQKGSQFPL